MVDADHSSSVLRPRPSASHLTHFHSENTNIRLNVPLTCSGFGWAWALSFFAEYWIAR